MILLLGGTREGREAAAGLITNGQKVKISVTTKYGASLLEDLEAEVITAKLNEADLLRIIDEHDISAIVDATHPFASKISRAAISVCRNSETFYIRYQRPRVNIPEDLTIISASDFAQAAEAASNYEKIFLTTGSKNFKIFQQKITGWQERLYLRILPLTNFVQRIAAAGLPPDNIIAMKGPFSAGLNRAILQEYNIDVLVTKASGQTGGLPAKLEAAKLTETPVIVISRPEIDFPRVVRTQNELIKYLESLL